MLAPSDFRIAKRFKRRLGRATPVRRLVVYGSRARGDAVPDSDLDIFVEVPELDVTLRNRIREIAWEAGLEEEVVITTFVTTTEAIEQGPVGANPLLMDVAEEGVTV